MSMLARSPYETFIADYLTLKGISSLQMYGIVDLKKNE